MQEVAQDTILNDNNDYFCQQVPVKPWLLLPILEMLQPEIQSVQCLIWFHHEN
jgi:hypothetical protein